jgi:hypothetical protein
LFAVCLRDNWLVWFSLVYAKAAAHASCGDREPAVAGLPGCGEVDRRVHHPLNPLKKPLPCLKPRMRLMARSAASPTNGLGFVIFFVHDRFSAVVGWGLVAVCSGLQRLLAQTNASSTLEVKA